MSDCDCTPGHGAEHQDRTIQHPHGSSRLDGEDEVARGIEDVDVVPLPGAVSGRRLDGDAALALEIHRVHLGAHAVLALHIVDGVDTLRVEEDALGQRRLARVDVGTDADVAKLGDVVGHGDGSSEWIRAS